jgi:hypothetical protein
MAFIGLVSLRRLSLRWGDAFPLEMDHNGLVGGPTGEAALRSGSALALEVITWTEWGSFRGNWRRKAGASAVADTWFPPPSRQFLMMRSMDRREDVVRFSCRKLRPEAVSGVGTEPESALAAGSPAGRAVARLAR